MGSVGTQNLLGHKFGVAVVKNLTLLRPWAYPLSRTEVLLERHFHWSTDIKKENCPTKGRWKSQLGSFGGVN